MEKNVIEEKDVKTEELPVKDELLEKDLEKVDGGGGFSTFVGKVAAGLGLGSRDSSSDGSSGGGGVRG